MVHGNPYRIRKPQEGVLWKGMFRPATGKGKFTGNGLVKFHAVLTAEYLWLSSELAIPLRTVRSVDLLNKDGAAAIIYCNTLAGRNEVALLCILDFLGFYDRKKVKKFHLALQQALDSLPQEQESQFICEDAGPGFNMPNLEAGCEKCGITDAALVELGTFYCIGIYPLIGAYSWTPKRRYLCRKHALQASMFCNLETALFGYLGFPGIFVAPIRVWKNIASVKRSFPLPAVTVLAQALNGILLPLVAIGYLIFKIWG